MRVIKTWQDIEILEDAEVLKGDYLEEIKTYFRQLHQALGPDEDLEDFRLDWPEGFIVILERGDNPWDLSTVGLSGLESRKLAPLARVPGTPRILSNGVE